MCEPHRKLLYFFDWSVSILNFLPSSKTLHVFFMAEMQTLLILLLQLEIILALGLKSSVARQKRKKSPFIGNACVSEKIIRVSGWAVITSTRQAFRFRSLAICYFKSYKQVVDVIQMIALVFIPKLARNKKGFISISVEIFL